MRGRPILPPTQVRRPLIWAITPVRAVVVVLPAEPVMPMTAAGERRVNSNESFVIWIPRFWAAWTRGASAGTPPLTARMSVLSNKLIGCSPKTNSIFRWASSFKSGPNFSAGRKSETTTSAPTPAANSARALPCRASPRMTSFLPVNSSIVRVFDNL